MGATPNDSPYAAVGIAAIFFAVALLISLVIEWALFGGDRAILIGTSVAFGGLFAALALLFRTLLSEKASTSRSRTSRSGEANARRSFERASPPPSGSGRYPESFAFRPLAGGRPAVTRDLRSLEWLSESVHM